MKDMNDLFKAAQEMAANIQGQMSGAQEQLDKIEVEGAAGGGLVKVTATAKGELKALSIDPSIFREEDREMVEDLILAAVKDAQNRAAERMNDEMRRMTEGLGLPPGMKLPF